METVKGSQPCPATQPQDLTEGMRSVEALTQQVKELRHANAELQQFAAIVSHDLQQPLLAVTMALELLDTHARGTLDAQAQHFLDHARNGMQQLQTMLADLRTYLRVGASEQPLTPTDTLAVWQQTLQNLRVQIADCGATISADSLPTVCVERVQLAMLWQNLLSNALKFRGPEPPRIHVSAQRQGMHWVFAVRDDGIGIDPQHTQRIFELFWRAPARREYPGTGMGLAICRKIVEQHGGRIWVESEVGQGTTFFFTLPAAQARGRKEEEGDGEEEVVG